LPTRNAAQPGWLFTRYGDLKLRNSRYRKDLDPVEGRCHCPTCRQFSRAYLHHLAASQRNSRRAVNTVPQPAFPTLPLMQDARAAIEGPAGSRRSAGISPGAAHAASEDGPPSPYNPPGSCGFACRPARKSTRSSGEIDVLIAMRSPDRSGRPNRAPNRH